MWSRSVIETLRRIEADDVRQKESGEGIPYWRISADCGRLLYIACRSANAQRAVELGSSSGYSGIHLAAALASTGDRLWTCELEPLKLALSRRNFEAAGVADRITHVEGDILETLPALLASLDGPLDFAFLDAVKPDYVRYLGLLRPHLHVGSLVAADNVGPHNAEVLRSYLETVGAAPFVTSIVPTRNAEGRQDALALSLVTEG